MLQHEQVPHKYVEKNVDFSNKTSLNPDRSVALTSIDPGTCLSATFTFEALTPNLFRTTFTTPKHPLPPHPSARKPVASFDSIVPVATTTDSRKTISHAGDKRFPSITANVDWTDSPVVSLYLEGAKKPIHRDLNFRSYAIDSQGICHYTAYKKKTLHVGLGEKAAPFDLSNRGFLLATTDSVGYDVYHTDPLYKHIPLMINVTSSGCVASFSTSHSNVNLHMAGSNVFKHLIINSRGTWLVGSEVDGLWGHYKVYRQAHGGLEEYLIVGRNMAEVLRSYAELVGFPKLVPRWAMGYIGGGMLYSMLDEPRAADAHLNFIEKLKEHKIPCSAFQMSSGYTVAETEPKTRNVFTWNRHRFPSPKEFTSKCHNAGIRLIANVKPYVLSSHPDYEKLARANALFKDAATGKTAVCRLWSSGAGESGEGSHIDFTSKAGFDWWYEGVKNLCRVGIDSPWNDNNEYTVPHDDWQLALERAGLTAKDQGLTKEQNHIGLWGRAIHTELMAQASHDALVDSDSKIRPFVLTRSATAGTMRYAASSWSGDNVTSWDGMRGANALSLNAGMSLLQSYGHDIGGFEGPQPSPELLLRWIQLGIHSPRFAINCYKTSQENTLLGDVIEPWQYPSITPLVRAAIKRRYELIPYLYSLALMSHMTATPPQRWVGWGYEYDAEVWSPKLLKGDKQYWLGDTLLVGGVYESGVTHAKMYLPLTGPKVSSRASSVESTLGEEPEEAYINLNAPFSHYPAGLWVDIDSPWKSSIPILARIGGCVPVGKSIATGSIMDDKNEFPNLALDDNRGVEIFPPSGRSNRLYSNTWYEDDGLSAEGLAKISSFTFEYQSYMMEIHVGFVKGEGNEYVPLWKCLDVILPVTDDRFVVSADDRVVTDLGRDRRGRRMFRIDACL